MLLISVLGVLPAMNVVTGGCEIDCALRVWDPKPGSCAHTTQGAKIFSVGAPDAHSPA